MERTFQTGEVNAGTLDWGALENEKSMFSPHAQYSDVLTEKLRDVLLAGNMGEDV